MVAPEMLVARLELLRGGFVESRHDIAFAEVSPGGAAGAARDAGPLVCLRSMAKPFQAVAALDDGTAEAFGLSGLHIAAACGIHQSDPVHEELVLEMLDLAQVTPDHLRCGELLISGKPSATAHYCAANHALVLLHCRQRGWPVDGYEDAGHPAQQAAATVLARCAAVDCEAIGRAIDNCAMPALFLPLGAVARAYGRLAVDGGSAATVAEAMRSHPQLVGGNGVIDSEVMRQLPGSLAKMGAEGLIAFALADGRAFAVKVRDGAERAVAPALLGLLRVAGVAVPDALAEEGSPRLLRSHDHAPIGELRFEVDS